MKNIAQKAKSIALSVILAVSTVASMPAMAVEVLDDGLSERPSTGAIILDAMVARPVGLIATVAGSAIFVATLPFSILGGNVNEAATILVKKPAVATFTRCLGCTALQDETKNYSTTP